MHRHARVQQLRDQHAGNVARRPRHQDRFAGVNESSTSAGVVQQLGGRHDFLFFVETMRSLIVMLMVSGWSLGFCDESGSCESLPIARLTLGPQTAKENDSYSRSRPWKTNDGE